MGLKFRTETSERPSLIGHVEYRAGMRNAGTLLRNAWFRIPVYKEFLNQVPTKHTSLQAINQEAEIEWHS